MEPVYALEWVPPKRAWWKRMLAYHIWEEWMPKLRVGDQMTVRIVKLTENQDIMGRNLVGLVYGGHGRNWEPNRIRVRAQRYVQARLGNVEP